MSFGALTEPFSDAKKDGEGKCMIRGCKNTVKHDYLCSSHHENWNSSLNVGADAVPQLYNEKGELLCGAEGCRCVVQVSSHENPSAKIPTQSFCYTQYDSFGRYCKHYTEKERDKPCPNAITSEMLALARQQVMTIGVFGNTKMAQCISSVWHIFEVTIRFVRPFSWSDLATYKKRREGSLLPKSSEIRHRFLDERMLFLDSLLGSKKEETPSQKLLRAAAASS